MPKLQLNAPVYDPVFEMGASAARAGISAADCPFPNEESMIMTRRERWMNGHRSAVRNTPAVTSCCGN